MAIIKALCYIAIVFSFLASAILLILGVSATLSNNPLGSTLVYAGIGSFIVSLTSAYPIFAIEIAEKKIASLETKVHALQESAKESNRTINQLASKNALNASSPFNKPTGEAKKVIKKLPTYKEAVEFINSQYGLSIFAQDSLASIKEKVESIDVGSFTAIIFKQKVSNAASEQELENIFITHCVSCD